ncbi:MAG: hypothetical protein ACOYKA_03930, partial [Legionellaceae bacterium]
GQAEARRRGVQLSTRPKLRPHARVKINQHEILFSSNIKVLPRDPRCRSTTNQDEYNTLGNHPQSPIKA